MHIQGQMGCLNKGRRGAGKKPAGAARGQEKFNTKGGGRGKVGISHSTSTPRRGWGPGPGLLRLLFPLDGPGPVSAYSGGPALTHTFSFSLASAAWLCAACAAGAA